MEEKDYSFLLGEYRKIWNNRLLAISDERTSEDVLKEAVRRELLDENSHPRIRKDSYKKFNISVKRILEAGLDVRTKLALLVLHTNIMDEIKETLEN
ncbi:hypothetical protein [Bacillus sp. B-jedd]|uniref:hypothetical protein n=1 Tax=Bacillus sp. B-jedd TaxID=1476857 RepID=UPI0005156DE6|nr:hypothetical protein [Bacillus sp. B-jedd]CEG27522.1 YojE [Bacillus sp. B-jedd]